MPRIHLSLGSAERCEVQKQKARFLLLQRFRKGGEICFKRDETNFREIERKPDVRRKALRRVFSLCARRRPPLPVSVLLIAKRPTTRGGSSSSRKIFANANLFREPCKEGFFFNKSRKFTLSGRAESIRQIGCALPKV